MAEMTRLVFTVLTVLFAAIRAIPAIARQRSRSMLAHMLFLVVYLGGILLLVNTAHLGGRLVHEFGVKAAFVKEAPGK